MEFEWNHYLSSEDYRHDIVTECITQVGAKVFRMDHAGSNAYIHLRRQIRELKVMLQKGIKAWEERIQDYRNIYRIAHGYQERNSGCQSYHTQIRK